MSVDASHTTASTGLLQSLIGLILLFVALLAWGQPLSDLEKQRINAVLPEVSNVSDPVGEFGVRELKQGDELVGYAFETINVVNIPAYSGKPINSQVILDLEGNILDAYVLHHEEPILLIGIPEHKLHDFAAKYQGIHVNQRVVIGRSRDKDAVTIDRSEERRVGKEFGSRGRRYHLE